MNRPPKDADQPIKLVTSNNPADINRARALGSLSHSLRGLAANLMRVVRGAGKTYELAQQMVDVVEHPGVHLYCQLSESVANGPRLSHLLIRGRRFALKSEPTAL